MGKHPIRCGFMCPLQIALTLGQVAHATSGRTLRGERGLWPFWAKQPKFTQDWSLEKSYLGITREVSLGLLHGCKPKLCLTLAIKVGPQSKLEPFLTPIFFEAHYLWGKVHILAIFVCTCLWVIQEQKYA